MINIIKIYKVENQKVTRNIEMKCQKVALPLTLIKLK